MMDLDIGLIGAICREGMPAFYERGLTAAMLNDRGRLVFNFVEEHWRAHQVVPQPETIKMETGIDVLYGPVEPLEFWAAKIRARALYDGMTRSLQEIVAHMERVEPEKAFAAMQAEVYRLAQTTETAVSRPASIFSTPQVMLDDYEKSKQGIMGVPTPWPSLNQATRGWMPEDFAVIAARPGQGKCLGEGTPVLMADGSTKMVEEIKVGDQVMGPDSKPRNVMSVCRGREEMFEIIPIKGEPWRCNRSHVLSLRMSSDNGAAYERGQIFNLSIDEYLARNSKFKHHAKLWRTGVDFPEQPVKVDPYLVGVWLGDGTFGRPEITNPEPEIIEYLHRYCADNGLLLAETEKRPGKCPGFRFSSGDKKNYLGRFFEGYCCIGEDKTIPKQFLVNSREVRLKLLAGLIDTDGFVDHTAGGCEIITKFTRLKDGILFLCRSLGLAAYESVKIARIKETGFEGEYWRIRIAGDLSEVPCLVPRKKPQPRRQIKNVLNVGFKVRSVGEGDYYGFELDGDHLFLLGDFTVTHNTWIMLIMAMWAWKNGHKIVCGSTEMSHKSLKRRVYALHTKLSYSAIRDGSLSSTNETVFREAVFDIAKDDRFILLGDGFDVSLNSIEAAIIEHKPDLVCIDGIYMLKVPGRFDRSSDNAAEIFKQTKALAKRRQVPILATSQMNRPPQGARAAQHDLSRLAFSDAAAQMTDYVFFLNQTEDMRKAREIELEPGKMREADFMKSVRINFRFDTHDFSELPEDVSSTAEGNTGFPTPEHGKVPWPNAGNGIPPDDPW